MALTYRNDSRWFNSDNLTVFFPGKANTPVRGGHVKVGGEHCAEIFITLSELPVLSSDSNGLLLAETVKIPQDVWVSRLETLVVTETAGTNANLNIGVVNATTMAIFDADYFLAAADIENAGTDVGLETVYRKGTTDAGTGVGAKTASDYYLCGAYDTGAFTAGVLRVRIFYSHVLDADD